MSDAAGVGRRVARFTASGAAVQRAEVAAYFAPVVTVKETRPMNKRSQLGAEQIELHGHALLCHEPARLRGPLGAGSVIGCPARPD